MSDDLKLLLARMRRASSFVVPPGAVLPLIGAVEVVLELHRRIGIYVECDCTDEQKQDGHEDIYEVGLTCNRIYDICDECCRDDVYQREDCANHHQHTLGGDYCPTVAAIRSALIGDNDECDPIRKGATP